MKFQPNRLPDYSHETLLAEIRRVITTHFNGHCPTQKEFNQFSRVHSATVVNEFGSWPAAMRAVGLSYSRSRARRIGVDNDSPEITPDILLRELIAIARKHNGTVFLYDDYKRLGGKRARGTFCKYLGGWRQAVVRIGLKDGFSRPRPDLRTYTDEDYFVEMQRLWETLGRQPMAREMRKHGKISPQSFQQRFGSWIKAIHSFCKDRSGPEASSVFNVANHSEPVDQNNQATETERPVAAANPQAKMSDVKKRTPRNPSIRLRFRVLQRDNFTCRACGRSPANELGVTLEVDHVVAWSRGGETTFENLQTLCARCNSGKSNI